MDFLITERRVGLRLTQEDLKNRKFWHGGIKTEDIIGREFSHKKPTGLNGIKLDIHELDQQMVLIPKKLIPKNFQKLMKCQNH